MPVKGFVRLTLAFRKVGKLWTGECLELGTATDSNSLVRVQNELMELVLLHLNTLEECGDRVRFFKEHNIRFFTDDSEESEINVHVPDDPDSFFQTRRVPVGAGS